MKIQKRPIKACCEADGNSVEELVCCPYNEAINHITSAIECLGEIAKEDPLARESIANLSVVLFDLKG